MVARAIFALLLASLCAASSHAAAQGPESGAEVPEGDTPTEAGEVAEADAAETEVAEADAAETEANAPDHTWLRGPAEAVLATLPEPHLHTPPIPHPSSPDARSHLEESLIDAIHGRSPPSGQRLHWESQWPRYRLDELIMTIGTGSMMLAAELLPTRADPNWFGADDFDGAIQDALSLSSYSDRDTARIASDAILFSLVAWPTFIDPMLAGLTEGAWDVAWQMGLISLEVSTITQAFTIGVKLLARRERPVGYRCTEVPGYDEDPGCEELPPAESFFSGHSSAAFASASVLCMHHMNLHLYGDPVADATACGTGLLAAAATGFLRVIADRHWFTDVATGALFGTATGLLVPYLLHYRGGARQPLGGPNLPVALAPMISEDRLGLVAFGLF